MEPGIRRPVEVKDEGVLSGSSSGSFFAITVRVDSRNCSCSKAASTPTRRWMRENDRGLEIERLLCISSTMVSKRYLHENMKLYERCT